MESSRSYPLLHVNFLRSVRPPGVRPVFLQEIPMGFLSELLMEIPKSRREYFHPFPLPGCLRVCPPESVQLTSRILFPSVPVSALLQLAQGTASVALHRRMFLAAGRKCAVRALHQMSATRTRKNKLLSMHGHCYQVLR